MVFFNKWMISVYIWNCFVSHLDFHENNQHVEISSWSMDCDQFQTSNCTDWESTEASPVYLCVHLAESNQECVIHQQLLAVIASPWPYCFIRSLLHSAAKFVTISIRTVFVFVCFFCISTTSVTSHNTGRVRTKQPLSTASSMSSQVDSRGRSRTKMVSQSQRTYLPLPQKHSTWLKTQLWNILELKSCVA